MWKRNKQHFLNKQHISDKYRLLTIEDDIHVAWKNIFKLWNTSVLPDMKRSAKFTIFQEHGEDSRYREVSKRLRPFWFKDLEVVLRLLQGVHVHNIILVDDSPHNNIFNNSFNVVHPSIFSKKKTQVILMRLSAHHPLAIHVHNVILK